MYVFFKNVTEKYAIKPVVTCIDLGLCVVVPGLPTLHEGSSEKCEGRPLPAYKVAQVPKKLMSGGGGGGGVWEFGSLGGGGGFRHFFFRPQNFCLDFAGT